MNFTNYHTNLKSTVLIWRYCKRKWLPPSPNAKNRYLNVTRVKSKIHKCIAKLNCELYNSNISVSGSTNYSWKCLEQEVVPYPKINKCCHKSWENMVFVFFIVLCVFPLEWYVGSRVSKQHCVAHMGTSARKCIVSPIRSYNYVLHVNPDPPPYLLNHASKRSPVTCLTRRAIS